jgi:hypothetical protein
MAENREVSCPECEAVDRRDFVRYISLGSAALATGLTSVLTPGKARAEELPMPKVRKDHLAEDLLKELFTSLSDEQKKRKIVRPFEDKARLSVNPNHALDNETIGANYTATQIELLERIVKAISGSEQGYWQMTRGGTWDASRSFINTGAHFFGDPTKDKYAFMLTGHHLTIRCDGDQKDGTAFGGPIYYGHTPNPYTDKNVFYYQTKAAMKFFDALEEKQKEAAVVSKGNPGEGAGSIKLKKEGSRPGITGKDLSNDQKELMETVMQTVLSPFRKEDVDEVMAIIKATGGVDKINFAFYGEEYERTKTDKKQPWSFWRMDGPGFVWNFRVLPHVHTYVNISSKES